MTPLQPWVRHLPGSTEGEPTPSPYIVSSFGVKLNNMPPADAHSRDVCSLF